MAITHDWQLDVGQGVSNLWFLLSQKEWGHLAHLAWDRVGDFRFKFAMYIYMDTHCVFIYTIYTVD